MCRRPQGNALLIPHGKGGSLTSSRSKPQSSSRRNPQPHWLLKHPGPKRVVGPLSQRHIPRLPAASLANATITRKTSLTTLAPYKHFILENTPPGTQPDETLFLPGGLGESGLQQGSKPSGARITPGYTPGSPGSAQSVGNEIQSGP